MFIEVIKIVFTRDLLNVKKEIAFYQQESANYHRRLLDTNTCTPS